MPAAYSYDFRQKAIDAVKRGEKKIEICRVFGISRNTLDLWLKRQQQTGDFQAKSTRPPSPHRKIKDWAPFREFVEQHGDKTQKEMARLWGNGVTQQNISDALQALGITRKKNPMDTANETRSSDKSF